MDMLKPSKKLQLKLKQSDPELQEYVLKLQEKIIHLRKQGVKLEDNNLKLQSRLKAHETAKQVQKSHKLMLKELMKKKEALEKLRTGE